MTLFATLWKKANPFVSFYKATKTATLISSRTGILNTGSLLVSRKFSNDDTLFLRARQYKDKTAIVDRNGKFSYNNLLEYSHKIGQCIIEQCLPGEYTGKDLAGRRVAFLCSQDMKYVAIQWAVWRNGGVAVPLTSSHPTDMLDYFIKDSSASLLVTTDEYANKVEPLVGQSGIPHLNISGSLIKETLGTDCFGFTEVEEREACWDSRDAMIVYTSGTTGRPKGVLTTHGNMSAQIQALVKAWGWTDEDCILHVLPLHHVHGIVNVLACPLWVGATCVMMPNFDAKQVWEYLTAASKPQLSLFMAVPTIYNKLIQYHTNSHYSEQDKVDIINKCSTIRLMVSGSSALPETDMANWEKITGHLLLERYGMTEIGMALSNPLHGPRLSGSVGVPLPGVKVRIVAEDEQGNRQVLVEGDENGSTVLSGTESAQGMLHVQGPAVFKGYWMRPDATQESFTEEGWFITGDTAGYKNGVYRIIGRPWDIIKSGGYKISALDVERELRQHPDIRDCAVLGVPDAEWGEIIAAIVALHEEKTLSLIELREWGTKHMVKYHIPRVLEGTDELPRNIMGKVNKKEIYNTYFNKPQTPAG